MSRRLSIVAAACALAALAAASQALAEAPRTGTLAGATPFAIDASRGDQTDPHVSGRLVAYTNEVSGNSEVRVVDLATSGNVAVPQSGSLDFLPDVQGGTVTFTRLAGDSAVWTYDAASGASTELAPAAAANRRESHVGGSTVVWQDFGYTGDVATPELTVLDLLTGATTRLTDDTLLDKDPSVSPDGNVIVWTKCNQDGSGCAVWEAVRGIGGGWAQQALTSPAQGAAGLADTDGRIVAYTQVGPSGDEDISWQPVGGGAAHEVSLPGQQDDPSVSGGVIVFDSLDTSTQVPNYDLYADDVARDTVYRLTSAPEDETLPDVSVTGRTVTAVWTKAELDDNVYGATFTLPPLPASLSLTPSRASQAVGTRATVTAWVAGADGAPLENEIVRIRAGALFAGCTTGSGGSCSISFDGPATAGTVTISGYVDTNLDGVADGDEPAATATRDFVADATPPAIAFVQHPDGANGWFRTAPATLHVDASDASGVAWLHCTLDGSEVATPDVSVSADGDHVVSCTAADTAGNTSPAAVAHLKLDATAPTVSVEGFADGAEILLGAAPPAATCTSDDAVSGVASTAGPTTASDLTANGVGTVSVTCTATDEAGNSATATSTYRIGYAFGGFLKPVQGAPAVNAGHAGRTYPLKWQLTDANGSAVGALSAVAAIRYRTAACSAFDGDAAPVDAETSGGSGLRYDATADVYVDDWATPAAPGCYVLSLSLDSGQQLDAYFRLT